MAVSAPAKAGAGSQFGMPGITRWLENVENNDGLVTTLSQTAVAPMIGVQPFLQTDVIRCWEFQFQIANTVTLGTQTVTSSPYFPYQFIGATKLNMQNQFSTIDVESGVDLAIFTLAHPYRMTDYQNVLYTQPKALSYSAAVNQISANNYTNASTPLKFRLEIPGGLQFDEYWPLDANGAIVGMPAALFVSPQYMAGTARIVQPSITFNPAFVTTADNGPYTVSGSPTTPATFAGSNTMHIKRLGYYQPSDRNGSDAPPVMPWQLTRKTQRQSLSGVSKINVNIPLNGQILLIYLRLFDPAANAGVGAPIPLTNVSTCNVVYGPGLFKYQDTPQDAQARFIGQHGDIPWEGVLIWDMALDERGRVTNARALNTMNTSGVQVQLVFTGTQSASAYAVIGIEALTYVAVGN